MFSIPFTMKERRRAWLIHLFETRFKGDRAAFMKETGYTKGRLTQFFDEDETFGERASRELARRITGLNEDYFENPLWPADSNPFEARIVAMNAALREIQTLDPVRFAIVDANLSALVASLRGADQAMLDSLVISGTAGQSAPPKGAVSLVPSVNPADIPIEVGLRKTAKQKAGSPFAPSAAKKRTQ